MAIYNIPINIQDHKLTKNEANILIKASQKGCMVSRNKLIESNLKLVLNLVHRYKKSGETIEDLFQIGTIGLIKAIDNFDVSKNLRFSTYAVPMILGEIRRHLRDHKESIRISRSIKDNAKKIWSFKETFLETNHREPTVKDYKNHLELSDREIREALESSEDALSLSTPLNANDGSKSITLEERIKDEKDQYEHFIIKDSLKKGLKSLNKNEKDIINFRYFLDKTQMEIGSELNLSQAQISRIEKKALSKLKEKV